MSFLKNWFTDRPAEAKPPERRLLPESAPVDLGAVVGALAAALGECVQAALDPDVVRAKIADRLRALGIEPPDPLEVDLLAAGLDRGGWERVGLLALALERGALGEVAERRIFDGRSRAAIKDGFFEVARSCPLVTLELLRGAPLRREELARRFVLGLGASIVGETVEVSRRALERIDYGRLMAEADRARRASEEGGRKKG